MLRATSRSSQDHPSGVTPLPAFGSLEVSFADRQPVSRCRAADPRPPYEFVNPSRFVIPPPDAVSPSPSRILLADADAFYVAVARLTDPEGAGRTPLLIVGGAADGRGVVTSASYEAREYGVRSAMPTAQALRLCPGATVVPVPRDVCSRKSREIRRVLGNFTPVVEPASIDEFYLDLTGTEQLYKGEDLTTTAARIRQTVIEETDLSVSIGGGTSKLVAKLAAKRAKPRPGREGSGVFIVPPGEEQAFLEQLDLADIPMIGPRFQEHLARYGLRRVKDALQHDVETLVAWFGERSGQWLYRRIRGRDTGHVEGRPRAKSLSHEETFAVDLTTDNDLERELLRLTSSVARDLRAKSLRARTITVKIRDADFTTRQASHTLPDAVCADRPIYETAARLLHKLRKARRTGARLLGIAGSHLAREGDSTRQLALFDEEPVAALETRRDQTIAHAMDEINVKYGRKGIVRAAEVRSKNERESPQ